MFELIKTHWFGQVFVEEWREIDSGKLTFKLGGLFFPTMDKAKEEIVKVYGAISA